MGCNSDKIAKLWGEKAHETLDERNKLLSWDSHPYTMAYINRRISGDADERWLQFVKRRFCPKTLNMGLSLGSGWGGLERDAIGLHICQYFDAYDISPQAIALAKTEALKQGFEHHINLAVFGAFSFNKCPAPQLDKFSALCDSLFHRVYPEPYILGLCGQRNFLQL